MRELLLPVCLDRIVSVVQAELGDIVYVELPEVGSEVKKGEQFGVIESVKVICCKLPYSLPSLSVLTLVVQGVGTQVLLCRLQVMSIHLYLERCPKSTQA